MHAIFLVRGVQISGTSPPEGLISVWWHSIFSAYLLQVFFPLEYNCVCLHHHAEAPGGSEIYWLF